MNLEKHKENRKLASDLLCSVLEGRISVSDAIERWPKDSNDKLIEEIYYLLYHFRDDADIRSKDKKYSEWQYNQFRSLLKELEC